MEKELREKYLLDNRWEKLELNYGHYVFIKGDFRVNMDGFIFNGMKFVGHFDEEKENLKLL